MATVTVDQFKSYVSGKPGAETVTPEGYHVDKIYVRFEPFVLCDCTETTEYSDIQDALPERPTAYDCTLGQMGYRMMNNQDHEGTDLTAFDSNYQKDIRATCPIIQQFFIYTLIKPENGYSQPIICCSKDNAGWMIFVTPHSDPPAAIAPVTNVVNVAKKASASAIIIVDNSDEEESEEDSEDSVYEDAVKDYGFDNSDSDYNSNYDFTESEDDDDDSD